MKNKEVISLKDLLVVKDFPYGEEDSQAEGLLNYQAHKRRVNESEIQSLSEDTMAAAYDIAFGKIKTLPWETKPKSLKDSAITDIEGKIGGKKVTFSLWTGGSVYGDMRALIAVYVDNEKVFSDENILDYYKVEESKLKAIREKNLKSLYTFIDKFKGVKESHEQKAKTLEEIRRGRGE
jgi:hypothetical protein